MSTLAIVLLSVIVWLFIALVGLCLCAAAGRDDERWGRK